MKLPRRAFLHLAAGVAALPAASGFAWAQTYPSRPDRIVVDYTLGSATDAMARLIAPQTAVVAVSQSHAETSTETFSSIVRNERISVCATSPIPTCENDFEVPALFAEWLDAEEERAIKFDKSNDDRAAKELRFQILQDAALLDIYMEQIRLRHLKK